MAATPGRKFFDEHLKRINAGLIDEMVDNDYVEDSVLITFFNGFDDSPPPITIKGKAGIKALFRKYIKVVGSINIKTVDFTEDFDGKSGYIFFQAIFTCNLGLVRAGDAFHMRGGKILCHFGFWASDNPSR
jgi:hypothetical protein